MSNSLRLIQEARQKLKRSIVSFEITLNTTPLNLDRLEKKMREVELNTKNLIALSPKHSRIHNKDAKSMQEDLREVF